MASDIPRVAIIGAGPGGLMLASILHHNNIPCIVFERDSSAVARAQGGSLDIHDYSGQKSIDAAGLLDKFRAVVKQGGDSTKIIKKDGTILLESSGQENTEGIEEAGSRFIKGRPEIDRPVLKDLLINSLPDKTIRWNSRVSSLTSVPNSKQWQIELDDGSHPISFDLVVGADGAWSHTRALLTDQQPIYSGITALDVWLEAVDEVAPDVSAFVGLGNCFIYGGDRALLFQRNGSGHEASVRCYACVKTNTQAPPTAGEVLGLEKETDKDVQIDWTDAKTRESYVERNFGDWSDEVKRTVLTLTDHPSLRPLYMLPVGLTWESVPGVTLVGDAAHLMTPFAGVGVNVALMDALELAQGIIDCVKTGNVGEYDLATMLQRYENGMFSRSGKEAAKTEAAMNLQFQEGGAERFVELMKGAAQPEDFGFE